MKLAMYKYQSIYYSQMNVIFDILIRFLTSVCNDSGQLLQNESPYLIAIDFSYIELRTDNAE
jgi:hypothetical protein